MYDYTAEDAFSSIDDFNYGYVDFSNLKRFLKKNGFIPTNKDLAAIIRRLDLNADSWLGKDEFIEGIKPVEPYSKVDVKGAFRTVVASKVRKIKKKRKEDVEGAKHFSKSVTWGRITNPYEDSPLRRTHVESSPLRKSSPRREYVEISPVIWDLHMSWYSPVKSPLRYGEEKEVVHVLNDLMRMETDLELIKTQLAIKPDFNLVDCFWMFDFGGRGWCTF